MNDSSKYSAQRLGVQPQSGAVLVVSLIMLMVLTVLGISALSTGTNSEQAAANIQQAKIAFFAGQSAVDSFAFEGNAGNDLTNPNQILALTRALANPNNYASTSTANALTRCTAGNGSNQVDCAVNYLGSIFKARSRAWYRGCLGPATACPGFSLGVGMASPGCHRYQIEGTGWVDLDGSAAPDGVNEPQATVDEWFSEVALCAGS